MIKNKTLLEAKILALKEFFDAKYDKKRNVINLDAYKLIMNKIFKLIINIKHSDLSFVKKIKYKRQLQKIAVTLEYAIKENK